MKLQRFIKDSDLVGTLYRNLKLRHDASFKIVKTKKQVRQNVEEKGCKLAIVVNDNEVGVLYPISIWRKDWRVRVNSKNKNFEDHGGITRMIGYLPVGTYYVYDLENNNNNSYWVESNSDDTEIDIEELVKRICDRVYPLAKKALDHRLFELRKKLIVFTDQDNNFDLGPDMVDNEHYHNENSFSQVVKNFEAVVTLYNDLEGFKDHIISTAKSMMTKEFGEWSRSTYHVGPARDLPTNPWGELWKSTRYGANRYRDSVDRKINFWIQSGYITERNIINDISLKIIWFYRNLIYKEREVRYWSPLTFPAEFV